jgi:hypothetical protein
MIAATDLGLPTKDREKLRSVVQTLWDIQDVRMRTENRIRAYSEHMGLIAVLGEAEATALRMSGQGKYKAKIRELKSTKKPDPTFVKAVAEAVEYYEGDDQHAYVNKTSRGQEAKLLTQIMEYVDPHPLWTEWLSKVAFAGPVTAGGLITIPDVRVCKHVGSLWKYMGQSVTVQKYVCLNCGHEEDPDEIKNVVERIEAGGEHEAPRCPKCDTFFNIRARADRPVRGEKIGYNPLAKVLAYKIGSNFVKAHPTTKNPKVPVYRALYLTMRETVDNKVKANGGRCHKIHRDVKTGKEYPCPDAHRFAMARRLTTKIFLSHFYLVMRILQGLPVSSPYAYGMLKHEMPSFIPPMVDEGEIPYEIRKHWEKWLSE